MNNKFPNYVATGGQTSRPFGEFIVPYPEWERLQVPEGLEDIDLNQKYKDAGWYFIYQGQHFLPGVTSEMIDWFWSNMEKGYYLWAPGSHKRFQWIEEPWEVGFTNSIHTCIENMHDMQAVDPKVAAGEGYGMLYYRRYDMDVYPFNMCLDHCIIEGQKDENGHTWFYNIHMWEDVEGGAIHRTAGCCEKYEQGALILPPDEFPQKPGQKNGFEHGEFELCHWPKFLPGLFEVWKDHPDPTQNVMYDLTVKKTGDEKWAYVNDNTKPVDLKNYFKK